MTLTMAATVLPLLFALVCIFAGFAIADHAIGTSVVRGCLPATIHLAIADHATGTSVVRGRLPATIPIDVTFPVSLHEVGSLQAVPELPAAVTFWHQYFLGARSSAAARLATLRRDVKITLHRLYRQANRDARVLRIWQAMYCFAYGTLADGTDNFGRIPRHDSTSVVSRARKREMDRWSKQQQQQQSQAPNKVQWLADTHAVGVIALNKVQPLLALVVRVVCSLLIAWSVYWCAPLSPAAALPPSSPPASDPTEQLDCLAPIYAAGLIAAPFALALQAPRKIRVRLITVSVAAFVVCVVPFAIAWSTACAAAPITPALQLSPPLAPVSTFSTFSTAWTTTISSHVLRRPD